MQFDRVRLCIACREEPCYRRYMMYHELAHLMSVGEIEPVCEKTYVRPWGICKTTYQMGGNGITVSVDRVNEADNERMNDCLAFYLYTQLELEAPQERWDRRRGRFAEMDQAHVIGCYLTHETI